MKIVPSGSARPEEVIDALGLRDLLGQGSVLVLAPIAYEAMAAPSMSRCGVAIISGTSLQAPGSDSSALTTR